MNIDGNGRVLFAQGGQMIHAKDGMVIAAGGMVIGDPPDMPFGPLKSANPTVMSRYNQPMVGNTILPDINRPNLMGYNATEYKMGVDDVEIPKIVNGQWLDDEQAINNYILTGERFKPMADPNSYSRYYDYVDRLGLMKQGIILK